MSSCNTTVSAPDGRTAPVNIRNASPDPIIPENGEFRSLGLEKFQII